MLNLILHITLPAGIRLQNSPQVLQQEVTFDILSACDPFYASVDQVKLSAGPLLRRMQDVAIACSIYNASQECDLMLVRKPVGNSDDVVRFRGAQNQWVQARAAANLLTNLSQVAGGPSARVLANFSITKNKGFEGEGIPETLKDLKGQLKLYDLTIRSGGKIAPGGHALPTMAAKGSMDWNEPTPGRRWVVTGMGANESTPNIGGPGGRVKPVKFFGSPMFGGPMLGQRIGIWQAGMSLYFQGSALAPAVTWF